MKKGSLIVISGFAGVGKGTIVKRLISEYDRFALSVSMTTRAPRNGEEDGREYFFVTKEQFEQTINADGFLEHAQYVGNYYGTPRAYVQEEIARGKDVILEIEVQGALQIKEKFPEAFLIFVTTPDAETLRNRLRGRGTESEDVIQARIRRAGEESLLMDRYDAVLVNDNLDEAVRTAVALIDSAKSSPERCMDLIRKMQYELRAESIS